MKSILLLFTINNIMQPRALVLHGGELPPSCSGSLHLYSTTGEHEILTESVESLGPLGILVSRIRVEGCGCYVLYQGSQGSGRAVFISQRGDQNIRITRIRSVDRVACEEYRGAEVVIIVISIVITILVILGISSVIYIKNRNSRYEGVISIEQL